MSFKETGNKIPISADELINYLHIQFSAYDNSNKTKSGSNPYTDIVIYTTKDGKTIIIPKEIQQQAIEKFTNTSSTNNTNNVEKPLEYEAVLEDSDTNPSNPPSKDQIYDNNYDLIKLGILFFIVIIVLYLFFNIDNDASMFSTKRIRYYLTK